MTCMEPLLAIYRPETSDHPAMEIHLLYRNSQYVELCCYTVAMRKLTIFDGEFQAFDGYSSNLNVTWMLHNGSLTPQTYQHVVDNDVADGGRLTWRLGADLPPPVRDYCAVVSNLLVPSSLHG